MTFIQLNASNVSEIVGKTFSNVLFWGTIIAACSIILLGFFFQKKKLLFQDWEKTLVKIIVLVGLPALIFKSFMTEITVEVFTNMIILFALGILFYFAMSLGSRVFFLKRQKSIQDTLSMCVVFPSAIYFGLPIAQALFTGNQGALDNLNQAANMFNVGYWIFMCSYAVYLIRRKVDGVGLDGKQLKTSPTEKKVKQTNKFSRQDFKKLILSPIIMSLMIGFVLWIMQLIPGIDVIHVTDQGWNTVKQGDYSITRLDALIPGVSQILGVLSVLPTPLAWLAVGAVVGKGDVKKAIKNKLAWYGVGLKNFVMPLLTLGLVAMFAAIGDAASQAFTISGPALIVIVLMVASPTATTVTGYAIVYDKEPMAASEVCTLTTICAAITMPIWTIIASIVATASIFEQF